MPAKLLFRDGQGADASVEVPENAPTFLGRGADCAVRTDDAMVSRKNCKLSFSAGKFWVEDLGSSNGTFVNERRIQKHPLAHGDVIRCGTLQVRYVEVSGRPRTEAVGAINSPQPFGGRSVQVDMGGGADVAVPGGGAAAAERDQALKQLKDQQGELDTLRAQRDAGDAELKNLRQQLVTVREEMSKTKRDHAQDKEELQAVGRAAEELRVESKQMREELAVLRSRTEEQTEELGAKERQIERAQEEVQRSKQTTEELRNKLQEVQKTKDEGWRELNSQLSQVEHLREVIAEQERILEERRVGLIAIESAAKDLRAEKEKVLRELVETKNQRDDLKDRQARYEAKIEGLEEEHRRLARLVSSSDGIGASGEDLVKMAGELRELKVEYKKIELEKGRALDNLGRIEVERDKLNEERARLDVERAQLAEEKKTAEVARGKAEEGRARAESIRQRIDEEKGQASSARDAALATADEIRRDLDRATKRIAELEKGAVAVQAAEQLKRAEALRDEAIVARGKSEARAKLSEEDLAKERGDVDRIRIDLDEARGDLAELRTEQARLQAEADELRNDRDALQAQLEEARGDLGQLKGGTQQMQAVQWSPEEGDGAADASDQVVGEAAADGQDDLRARAQEVYDGINLALSELRQLIMTAEGLFGQHGQRIPDAAVRKKIAEALSNSVDRTEEAKGLLRGLKELTHN